MIGKDIQKAVRLLNSDQVIGMPTETVYGLAGNALSEKAVLRIFKVKNRPRFNPLIIHLSDVSKIEKFADFSHPAARRLAQHFMPGPLTLLLPKHKIVPDLVTAGSNRVAVRIPNHPLSLELMRLLDFPLAAPSANPFGYISPTTAYHVEEQLGDRIPYILDGGLCGVGLESTIVGFEENDIVIYRKGGIAVEEIEHIAGPVVVNTHSTSNPETPGKLQQHYSPTTPIEIGSINEMIAKHQGKNLAILSYSTSQPQIDRSHQFQLSPGADLDEAARNLFLALRYLDGLNAELILAELVPEEGLGRAINDRLRRGAAKS